MFQNVQYEEVGQEDNNKMEDIKNLLKNIFTKKNILIYVITLLVSMIGLGGEVSPFSIALVGASFAAGIPAFGIIIISIIGNIIGFGASGGLNYILTLLMLMITFAIKRPIYNEENKNEKIKLSKRLFICVLTVMIFRYVITSFTIYNLLANITNAIIVVIFYKIFTNSLKVLEEINEKKAFSLEEVMGASLVLAVAISALGGIEIFGLSLRNILSILIVLILGWKNGVLIGTTSGVTIGAVLGVIAQYEPSIVALYAISGMLSGLLNRFGKIGVILGFVIGNGILAYISNGTTLDAQILKEILVAAVGLIVVPSNINISIEEFMASSKLLPAYSNKALVTGQSTLDRLNVVSETIGDIARTYDNEEETDYIDSNINNNDYNKDLEELIQEKTIEDKNRDLFISELLNELDDIKDNMLYDDLSKVPNKIVNELYLILTEQQQVTRQDLLKTFAKFNSYIIGFEDENVSKYLEDNITQVINKVNSAYRVSKTNFICQEKIKENKKSMQSQLGQISKAISNIATQIQEEVEEKEEYTVEREKILMLLKQKDIKIEELWIRRKKGDRYFIDMYLNILNQGIINNDIEKIERILTEVLNDKIKLNEKTSKITKEKSLLAFMSADKYEMNIGITGDIKNKSTVSGDSILNIRLNDGKNLIAISDGMGSGPEARKSSQIAIKMLERLLASGFNQNISIELINKVVLNNSEEIFATLDIAIVDLYKGNIEFIKNGACPTYIKNDNKVQIIKTLTLPTGALEEIKLTTYDKDLANGDIIVMCSDGIIDSNIEYKKKELWLKYLLEDMETQNAQKMADIILKEAIDNNYGINKDDMSVIVLRVK
ncbi:MAG: SpoIIE family protein phosphatase [Clostridia bacterium]|nr:SpoIIE family protein phosphatase [Clostridia bacterium]